MKKIEFFDRKTVGGRLLGKLLTAAQNNVRAPLLLSEEERCLASKLARYICNHRGAFPQASRMLELLGMRRLAKIVVEVEELEKLAAASTNTSPRPLLFYKIPLFGPFWANKEKTKLEQLINAVIEREGDELSRSKFREKYRLVFEFIYVQRQYWSRKRESENAQKRQQGDPPPKSPESNSETSESNKQ